MIYVETSSGGSRVAGCATVMKTRQIPTYAGAFVPGDKPYVAAKARRGVLEKVVIKEVRAVQSRRTLGVNRVLYVDTFNGLWNEYDVVHHEEALSMVEVLTAQLQDDLNALKKS